MRHFSFCNEVFVTELHEHACQDWMCNVQCDFSSWVGGRQKFWLFFSICISVDLSLGVQGAGVLKTAVIRTLFLRIPG